MDLRLIDGPATAPATLLLAHGAGAPMDSPFMAAIATGLAARGWRVVRFEFPYMAQMRLTGQRRAPDRLPRLLDAFRQQVALAMEEAPAQPLLIGGKSLGGRVASLLADQLAAVCGCLCLGYPFHPPGRPAQLRTEHLETLGTPTLILQGERDPFGRRGEVEAYPLSQAIELEWIPAGDHSFKPTRISGRSEAGNWSHAVDCADRWCRLRQARVRGSCSAP
jgi:predicted alpha/beta-hydrolase family hydrolase